MKVPQNTSPVAPSISKEELYRTMASEGLLKSIGVDIQKFMSQPAPANPSMSADPQSLGKLFGFPI